MTISRLFASDSTALDEHLDQLVEVLAELLAEPIGPAHCADDQENRTVLTGLRSSSNRVTHGVVNLPGRLELQPCQ
jgi:hypothetical protein